jgi:hypothetical protein
MSTDYRLSYGTHESGADGRCAMEWVAHLASEPHSDEPRCVSVLVRVFCTTLNDTLDDDSRQRLRPYLTRTIGTAGDGLDHERGWRAMDWLVRSYTPAWLALAGLEQAAAPLRAAAAIDAHGALSAVLPDVQLAREQARSALGRAHSGPWAAPWIAGRLAARESAWSSGASAAWAAARLELGHIDGDRARAAARTAAGDAAASVIRSARRGLPRHQARAAAELAVAPTVAALRESAFALLDRMLPGHELAELGELRPADAPRLVALAF